MKNFLRFLITVLIIGIIIYAVYFLVTQNKIYKQTHPVEFNTEENTQESETNEPENEIQENIEPVVQLSEEEIISNAKDIENANMNANVRSTIEGKVGLDVIGMEYSELFEMTNMDSADVTIQVAGTMVNIMPFSDFIDNQEFHYDERGNLVLFAYTEQGRGLKTRIYVHDGKVIKIEKESEDIEPEPVEEVISGNEIESGNIEKTNESTQSEFERLYNEEQNKIDFTDMFSRSQALYEKYIKIAE